MSASYRSRIHVVAAALAGPDDTILIATRPPGSHLAGSWEFPGGKLQQGELPLQGLARELEEELGVVLGCDVHRPLGAILHSYADRDIFLQAWWTSNYSGDPIPLEGQRLQWCSIEGLAEVQLLPADAPLIAALRLPARLVQPSSGIYTVGARQNGKLRGQLCSGPDELLAKGNDTDFIVMTSPLGDNELTQLCARTRLPVFAKGIDLEHAWKLGATGVNDAY